MKDLTHYFGDLNRNSESATVPTKEVTEERAKVEETALLEEEPRPKRKRGRVKIKISRKSSEGTVCDIVESSTDLVDKTPSPYPQTKRRHVEDNDDTPKRMSTLQESSAEAPSARLHRKIKRSMDKEIEESQTNATGGVASAEQTPVSDRTDGEKSDGDTEKKKRGRPRKEYTEKLIQLAEKKGYAKRKALEEQEAEKMERIFEKRRKYFTVQPKNEGMEATQGDENSPKNSEFSSVKRPGSLLNYFSIATPEHLEKERLMKAKLTVKAEIHTPTESSSFITSASDKKKECPKKKKTTSKKLEQEFDQIEVIQTETETVVFSPKNEKIKTLVPHTKPKWSLKIQLQSDNVSMSGLKVDDDDEEIYTPTAPSKLQKENVKNSDKIPKILLPIKNKKSDSSITSLDSHLKKSEDKSITNGSNQDKSGKNENNKDDKASSKREKRNSVNDKEEKLSKREKPSKRERKDSANLKEDTAKTDEQKTEKLKDCSTTEECNNQDESVEVIEMIEIEENSPKEGNSLKRKSKEKLAPLFTKRIKPSAEVLAARRLFLQSDISESTSTKKKLPPVGPKMLPFPKISHVNQLQPTDITIADQKFSLKNPQVLHSLFDLSLVKNKSILNKSIPISEHVFECVKSDVETVLSDIESYCPDVRTLWKYVSAFAKPVNPKPAMLKTRRRTSEKKNSKKPSDSPDEVLHYPWTDRYKPNSTAELVGNEEAAVKLKAWLEGWKSVSNNEDYSSADEFYNSDCSSGTMENNHVAILVGPHGSGKTASVYAVAHELGYKVLEVNASSKRPGKKILKDFEEATKSHRVKKSTLKDAFVTIPKKEEEAKKISQNSLILFEDVDLIFEEDEGFVSAAFQLASNTKRPIVMTLRDTCSYLPKLAPQQFRINFLPVSGQRVPALLQLVTLAETGCRLSQNCIDTLCQTGDLRKGLLQLQYLLISGKDRISCASLAVNNAMWKEIKTNYYKPAIKADKSKKKKQTADDKNLPDDVLHNLVDNLDRFSVISTLIDIEDPTSQLIDIKSEPSMSLAENMNCYSSLENTSLEISNWLKDALTSLTFNVSKKSNSKADSSNYHLTKKQINRDVDSALSQIAVNTLDRRALSVDYLSSIRAICRAEEIRNQLNSKRGNRFFHYLQNSRLASGAARSGNILSAACKMLQEKSET